MTDHDAGKIWPTFAFRAWLAALLAQTRNVHERLEKRIGWHERIIAHLREKVERSRSVIRSLEEALEKVDRTLQRVRDSEILNEQRRSGEEAHEGGVANNKPAAEMRGRQPARGGKQAPE
jgi:hypothetical protein